MTFSMAGHCVRTGVFGVAVSTSSLAVGSRCSWVQAQTGAAVVQNYADPSLGSVMLRALADCMDARSTVDHVVALSRGID